MIDILDTLLAPLARLLVARGVLFPELAERMKAHYIQAAEAEATDGKATDSRLSVLTGLQRRDVARLREFTPRDKRPSHLTRLVALWQTRPGYQQDGNPRTLARNGVEPSFEALARMVRRDVHARTMLDTLLATGTVGLTDNETAVELRQTSYQPLAGSEDQLSYLARNMGDHLSAATENVLADTPPHFERAVHYSGLTSDQIQTLNDEFRIGQMALLQDISTHAAELKNRAVTDAAGRFRAGGYFYQTQED